MDGLDVLAVNQEVHPAGPPIGRVDVELRDVDRDPRRIELVRDRGIAERVDTHPHRRRPGLQSLSEDLEDADLGGACRLVLQPDHPHGGHRPRAELHPRADLEPPVVRRPAPLGRLGLAHHQAVAERLLPDRAADRAGEDSGLNPDTLSGSS